MSEPPLLWTFVCTGDLEKIEWLLKAGADANMLGPNDLSLLHAACFKGYVQIAKLLIDRGAAVNTLNPKAGRPLHCACAEGRVDIVNLLLDSGAIINARAASGITPLAIAIRYGHMELVEVLLSRGAQECVTDAFLLHLACIVGCEGIARMLIKSGVNVNEKDWYGVTPLAIAIERRNKQLAEVLIDEGADLNKVSCRSSASNDVEMSRNLLTWEATLNLRQKRVARSDLLTPFQLADYKRDDAMMRLLVERGARIVHDHPDQSMTPLHYACEKGYKELATFLLESGANVNETNSSLETPLHVACTNGRWRLVEVLSRNNADLEAKTSYGSTPYYLAGKLGNVALMNLLIDAGAKVDGFEHTTKLLYSACEDGNIARVEKLLKVGANADLGLHFPNLLHLTGHLNQREIMKILIKAGADVNKRDLQQRTLLHKHCQAGRAETVEVLLDSGARASEQDNLGDTPLHMVGGPEEERIVELLLSNGASVNEKNFNGETPLHSHCKNFNGKMVRLLLAAGANVREKDIHLKTPLLHACGMTRSHLMKPPDEAEARKRVEIIKVLLSSGASINERDQRNRTPMGLACRVPHPRLFEILLQSGVDVNEKLDEWNQTPILAILRPRFYANGGGPNSCYIKAVKVLLDHGANIDGADEKGETCLHLACQIGDLELLKLLLEYGANPNKPDAFGMSSLHYARKKMTYAGARGALLKILLHKGADVNLKDAWGNTALHYVSVDEECYCFSSGLEVYQVLRHDQREYLKVLVDAGADVNLKNNLGQVPLQAHISDKEIKMDLNTPRLLLEAGTKIAMLNIDGELLNSQCKSRLTLLLDYGVGDLACSCEKCANNNSVMMCAFSQAKRNAAALRRHVIKLRAAELDVPKLIGGGLTLIENKGDTTFRRLCEKEVRTMKIESLGDSGFTYYDLLRRQNPSDLRGRGLPWSLTADTCRQKFPIYGDMLYSRLVPVKKKLLLDHCSCLFELADLPRLAPECVLMIFENLSFSDMLNVANVCDVFYQSSPKRVGLCQGN